MRHTVRGWEPIGDDATTLSIKVRAILVATTPGTSLSRVYDSVGPSEIMGWNEPSRGMLGDLIVGSTQFLPAFLQNKVLNFSELIKFCISYSSFKDI